MTRKLSISSAAFEDLIRRLPDYVDFIVTADKTHKFLQLDDVTYVAPLDLQGDMPNWWGAKA